MDFLYEARNRLNNYLKDDGWELYDGVDVNQDSRITICDIVLSVALNSKLDSRTKVWRVWQGKDPVEHALSDIPTNVSLGDADIPWQQLRALYAAACAVPEMREARSTKILHKKRPALIPIYDSVIGEHAFKAALNNNRLWNRGGAEFLIAYTQYIRDLLLANRSEVYSLVNYACRCSICSVKVKSAY